MKTKEQIEAFEKQAMGGTYTELLEANPILARDKVMFAMSVLSDAQELLAMDAEQNAERVRQYLNRAKRLLIDVHDAQRLAERGI